MTGWRHGDAASDARFVVIVRDKRKRTMALRDDETRVLSWGTREEAEIVARQRGGEVLKVGGEP